MLISALRVLLATGARNEPDDPWEVPALLAKARRLAGDDPALAALVSGLDARGKGPLLGPIRIDLTLPLGKVITVEYIAAADEAIDVDVCLKAGSASADLDLVIRDGTGAIVTAETGPETGIVRHAQLPALGSRDLCPLHC